MKQKLKNYFLTTIIFVVSLITTSVIAQHKVNSNWHVPNGVIGATTSHLHLPIMMMNGKPLAFI
jgi:hypothetical protein